MECEWIRTSEHDLEHLRKASKGVAVIPLACIETHGPHLPLGSDPLALDKVIERVVAMETVAVLPTLSYATVFGSVAGSGGISLHPDLAVRLLENICDEVYRNGFEKIVLLQGHGGNFHFGMPFLVRMIELGKQYALYSIPVYAGKSEDIRALRESSSGGHACELETSVMMATDESLVNLGKMKKEAFISRPGPDVGAAQTPVFWHVRHPEMCVGEPHKATREKGEKALDLWAEGIAEILRKIKRDKMVAPAMRKIAREHKRQPKKAD